MSAVNRLVAAATILAAFPVCPLTAQLPVNSDCDRSTIAGLSVAEIRREFLPRYPDSVYQGMLGRITGDNWPFLADSLVRDFASATDSLPKRYQTVFAAQLDTLRIELDFAQSQPDFSRRRGAAGLVRLVRFNINRVPNRDAVYLFRGFPHELEITAALPSNSRRALCWRAIAIGRMLSAYGRTAQAEALERLDLAATRWDNYGAKGQSQFPWELALNSALFSAKSLDPPRRQFILLHPALGVELAGAAIDDLRRLNVVTVEPAGVVWYNRSRSFFYGISAVASFPSDERVGIGAMLHLGRFAKAGYIWRAHDSSGASRNGIVLTVDLYRFLSGIPEKIKGAKAGALAADRRQLQAGGADRLDD